MKATRSQKSNADGRAGSVFLPVEGRMASGDVSARLDCLVGDSVDLGLCVDGGRSDGSFGPRESDVRIGGGVAMEGRMPLGLGCPAMLRVSDVRTGGGVCIDGAMPFGLGCAATLRGLEPAAGL